MASQIVSDDQQWPKLTAVATDCIRDNGIRGNDWEILDDANTPKNCSQHGVVDCAASVLDSEFIVIDDTEMISIEDDHKPSAILGRKSLRHSVSSPLFAEHASGTSKTSQTLKRDEVLTERDEDDGFSIISEVASVWTTSSNAKSTMTVSFRDAILLSSPHTVQPNTYRSVAVSSIKTKVSPLQQQSPRRQRSRVQPKIVVVETPPKHMRRCSKSTGDLLSLSVNISDEFNVDNISSLNTPHTRCTDRLYDDEVYYHKAIGATSRMNGLKLRPDEAKRRDMILFKKEQQRQLSSRKHNFQ
jgi:hypothetical protein